MRTERILVHGADKCPLLKKTVTAFLPNASRTTCSLLAPTDTNTHWPHSEFVLGQRVIHPIRVQVHKAFTHPASCGLVLPCDRGSHYNGEQKCVEENKESSNGGFLCLLLTSDGGSHVKLMGLSYSTGTKGNTMVCPREYRKKQHTCTRG